MHPDSVTRWLILGLAAGTVTTLAALAGLVPLPPAPRLGYQGQRRHRAVEESTWFRTLEPALRFIAGFASLLPLRRLEAYQHRLLMSAAFPLGITCAELSAISLVSGVALTSLAAVLVLLGKAGPALLGLGLILGLMLPTLRIRELQNQRAKEISRALPHGIEIAAMCMGAGLDFPAAIRLLAQPTPNAREPLEQEFRLILEELDVGHTRKEALKAFAERVPTDAVRDFVNAVVQAEEKGNPLAQVLRIQGQVLGRRRSTRAEEAASRAGVMLVIPLVLLLSCVLVLLVGPAVISNGLFR